MSNTLKKGSSVTWKWGSGTAEGTIAEVFHEDVTRTIKGREITRKASPNQPAYLIEQADGDKVLKSHSEVESA